MRDMASSFIFDVVVPAEREAREPESTTTVLDQLIESCPWIPAGTRCARAAGMKASLSLDRLRVDRRAGAPGDHQRRAAEEELVDLVARAILRELLEIEHLAHGEPHRGDHHPVPGLLDLGGFIGPRLHAPGIGADRRDLLVLAPIAILEFHPRRVAARVAAPFARLQAALHLAGADNHEIAAADFHVLRLRGPVELVVRDAVAVLEIIDALLP